MIFHAGQLFIATSKNPSVVNTIHHIYMVFTTDGFFEVATERWPEWVPTTTQNSAQTLKLTEISGHEFNSCSNHICYMIIYTGVYVNMNTFKQMPIFNVLFKNIYIIKKK